MSISPISSASDWPSSYKETFLELSHDDSMLELAMPDDCLVVVGPARLSSASSGLSSFTPVGFLQGLSYTETRQVQPLKALGSRRHIFSVTNQPVQIQIARLMFNGANLYKALYSASVSSVDNVSDNNTKIEAGQWYTNAEDDIYRIPFGMGVIYKNPDILRSTATYSNNISAEYFESCVIATRQVDIQTSQTTIVERLSLYCDRVVPFNNVGSYS